MSRQLALALQTALIERYDGIHAKLRSRFGVIDSVYVDTMHPSLNKAFNIRCFDTEDGKPLYDLRVGLRREQHMFWRSHDTVCMAIEEHFAKDAAITNRINQSCSTSSYDERVKLVRAWLNAREVVVLDKPLEQMTGADTRWRIAMESATPMGMIGKRYAYYK